MKTALEKFAEGEFVSFTELAVNCSHQIGGVNNVMSTDRVRPHGLSNASIHHTHEAMRIEGELRDLEALSPHEREEQAEKQYRSQLAVYHRQKAEKAMIARSVEHLTKQLDAFRSRVEAYGWSSDFPTVSRNDFKSFIKLLESNIDRQRGMSNYEPPIPKLMPADVWFLNKKSSLQGDLEFHNGRIALLTTNTEQCTEWCGALNSLLFPKE